MNALTVSTPDKMTQLKKYSPEERQLIKDTICRGATDEEAALFIHVAESRGLCPFAKQIHFVKRFDSNLGREVASHQAGIDAFRLIAQRTGEYEGQTPAQWCGEDGIWKDVWLSSKPPVAAKVGVYRRGFREPCYAIARYASYVQTKRDGSPNHFWAKMPDSQTEKCAESKAFRKAFPEELSGLYTQDEMGQAENEAPMSRARDITPQEPRKPSAVGHLKPVSLDAEKSSAEWIMKIADCKTQEELAAVAVDLNNASLSKESKAFIKPVFLEAKERLEAIAMVVEAKESAEVAS